MFPTVKWLFFDVGSTLVDEQLCYVLRLQEIASLANLPGPRKRLHRHGILQFFDLIVASAEEGLSKPNRRIFETALQKSGCAPDQAVMIGDRIDNDILPARQLGMHTVWVRQGFGQYWKITNEAEKPDYQVDNLAELCKLLL